MNKSWIAIVVLILIPGSLLADDKKKKPPSASSSVKPASKPPENKPKLDNPKPKIDTPKPAQSSKGKSPTVPFSVKPPDTKPKIDLPKVTPKVAETNKDKPPVVPFSVKPPETKPKLDTPKPKIDLPIPAPSNTNKDRDRQRDKDQEKFKLTDKIPPVLPGVGTNLGSGLVPGQPKRRPDNDDHDHDKNRKSRSNLNSVQQGHNHNDHDHDHHHHSHVQKDTLIRLFLFSNFAGNRPYGYGGYHDRGVYHYHNHPQFIPVPVQPLDQNSFSPNVVAPPPPKLVVPTADQFGSLAAPHQRELLLHAINSLDGDLTGVATGDQWKQHLQLDGLQASLAEIDGPLDAADREKFRTHGDVFEDVARQPAYRAIVELWGFGTLRVGLREFSLEPIVRIRRAIAMNAEWLSKSLDGVSTGSQWKQHLRLSQLTARDAAPLAPVEELAAMEPILSKFGKIKADPQFESIAAMPGFLPTQAALNDYVQELQFLTAPSPVEAEPPKTLPPPPAPKEDSNEPLKPSE